MTDPVPTTLDGERARRERRQRRTPAREVDVGAFAQAVKGLPVFKDCPRSVDRTEVRVVHSADSNSGYAHGSRLVRIRINPRASVAWLLETIVHELVHAALPEGVVHNERFRRTLARAARELWAISTPEEVLSGRPKVYALDAHLEARLAELLDAGEVTYPNRTAIDPEARSRLLAERHASMRQKKAAHAARMLALWERRLRQAERLSAKWRRKVAHYDRPRNPRGTP